MKKNSKMLIALLLAVVMLMATACSSSDEVKKPASVNGDSSVISDDEPADNNTEDTETDTTESDVAAEVTIVETVLYDVDGIKVLLLDMRTVGWDLISRFWWKTILIRMCWLLPMLCPLMAT